MKTEIMEVCNQEMKKKEGKNKGFSLVELIVVIAIMAILAIVIAPQVMKYIGQSRTSVDDSNAAIYKTAATTALANETAYKEVVVAGGVTITMDSTGFNCAPKITGKTTTNFEAEFKEILSMGTDPVLPKDPNKTKFTVTIKVTGSKVGEITAKAE